MHSENMKLMFCMFLYPAYSVREWNILEGLSIKGP